MKTSLKDNTRCAAPATEQEIPVALTNHIESRIAMAKDKARRLSIEEFAQRVAARRMERYGF